MRRAAPSLRWLTLAVLLPILLLAGMAVLGMRAQTRLAWDAAEEQAARSARAAAAVLAGELENRIVEVPDFPDPPLPGESSPLDDILDGNDPAALLALRDDPDAGLSPAGLPRRALASLRLMELDPQAQPSAEVLHLVTMETPSILTETVITKLSPPEIETARQWHHLARVRNLLRSRPEGGWIGEDDAFWWVRADQSTIAYLSPEAVTAALAKAIPADDPSFSIRISTANEAAPLLLATAPVTFGEGLRVEAWLRSADLINGNVRRQQAWTLSLLTVAMTLSIGGLFLIQRTLLRERKLNEMKSQFVASVSHELRAPVASIRLMADALEAGKVAPETAGNFHRLIAREGARLSTLVGNILDHARIEQGRREWKRESCDLAALVSDTVKVMEPLAQEKNINLLANLSPVTASVDAAAIQQALINLLDNAIKFSPTESTIETLLAIDEVRTHWVIRVKDEGPGIPKEEHRRIFERFYRPGDELRRETQGTGIGLSLVKTIAEAHGGKIRVESEVGKGSTFVLRIPISP